MADLTGLVTGLSQGLSAYLGEEMKQGREVKKEQYKNTLETQKQTQLQQQQSQLTQQNEKTKFDLQANMTPEMGRDIFSQVSPEFGEAAFQTLSKAKTSNGRDLTIEEAGKALDPVMNALKIGKGNLEEKKANREQRFNNTVLDFGQKMRNDYLLKKMNEKELALESSDALAALVQSGNTVAASGMGAQTARAMGEVGVLTATDVKNYITSKQLTRGAADKLLLWMEGKPTDATLEEIRQINSVIKDRFDKKVRPITDDYVARLAESTGIPREEAARKLNVPYGTPKQEKKVNADPLGLGI